MKNITCAQLCEDMAKGNQAYDKFIHLYNSYELSPRGIL